MRTKKAFFVLLSRSLKSAVHLFAWVTAPAPSLATCSSFGISSDCSRPVTEWLLEVSRLILLHVMLPPGTNVLCLTLPLAQETGYKHLTIIIRVQANPNSCFPAWEARWIVVFFFFFFWNLDEMQEKYLITETTERGGLKALGFLYISLSPLGLVEQITSHAFLFSSATCFLFLILWTVLFHWVFLEND